jgi:ABC-type glutathione transport system ATPase component
MRVSSARSNKPWRSCGPNPNRRARILCRRGGSAAGGGRSLQRCDTTGLRSTIGFPARRRIPENRAIADRTATTPARLKSVQPPLLSLSDVRKRYGRRLPWVLRGIDLSLDAGTGKTVVGGNGSGKSTILRIAAGLARQTSGSVSRPANVGYVPERQPATIRMSGAEYIANMGRIRGLR